MGEHVERIRPAKGIAPAPARQWLRMVPVIVICLVVVAFAGRAVLDPSALVNVGDQIVLGRVIAGVIAGFFLLMGVAGLLALLLAGNRFPRFVADDEGLAIWTTHGHAEIPWQEIAAIGIGYKITPRITAVRLPEGHALEIFLRHPRPAERFPEARRLVVDEAPPVAGLPSARIRFLPLVSDLERIVGEQVAHRTHYLGSYQRAWHAMPGR